MSKKVLSRIIVLIPVMSVFLIGAKFDDVELKNLDSAPLVNLNMIITEGGNGEYPDINPYENGTNVVSDPKQDSAEEKTPVDIEKPNQQGNVQIEVWGKEIRINDHTFTEHAEFEKYFSNANKSKRTVTLSSDYAEYHTLVYLYSYFTENNVSYTGKEG